MQKNFYIDNERFLNELVAHRDRVKISEETNTDYPMLSNYIGECFLLITNNFSNRPNFIGYSFKDEMIADAIENCISAAHKFDPSISKNPFSYFTQITFFAFLRRIITEKKQQKIKYRMIEEYDIASMIDPEDEEMMRYLKENIRKQVDVEEKLSYNIKKEKKSKKTKEVIDLFD